jgi:hypothetical protein
LETSDLLNNRGEKENICIPYVRVLVVSSLSFTEKGKIGKKILGPIINKKKIILRCILTITCISIDNRKNQKILHTCKN